MGLNLKTKQVKPVAGLEQSTLPIKEVVDAIQETELPVPDIVADISVLKDAALAGNDNVTDAELESIMSGVADSQSPLEDGDDAPFTPSPDGEPEPVGDNVAPPKKKRTRKPKTEPEQQAALGVGTVHTVGDTDNHVDVTEMIETMVPVNEPLAEVHVSMGMTRNLGNFESVRFDVSIKLPCALDADEVEETYAQCKDWVESKVNAVNAELDEQLG